MIRAINRSKNAINRSLLKIARVGAMSGVSLRGRLRSCTSPDQAAAVGYRAFWLRFIEHYCIHTEANMYDLVPKND